MRIDFEKQEESITIINDELNIYIYTINGCHTFIKKECLIGDNYCILSNSETRMYVFLTDKNQTYNRGIDFHKELKKIYYEILLSRPQFFELKDYFK